ncbi:MAG: hypothetical protein P1U54_09250 [Immundisolibacteraceae bacterium]|nr:hypothetical protein [Immundisolibacteraceae bacterium]
MNKQNTMEMPAIQRELFTRYPHVWEQIMAKWGTLVCPGYLKQLVIVETNRERAGFSQAAIAEVLTLIKLHDDLFPHHAIETKKASSEVWDKDG